MKTLKYISKAVEFLKSFNISTKANTEDQANLKLTNPRFGLNSINAPNTGKTSNSLLSQLYSEDNETLFI